MKSNLISVWGPVGRGNDIACVRGPNPSEHAKLGQNAEWTSSHQQRDDGKTGAQSLPLPITLMYHWFSQRGLFMVGLCHHPRNLPALCPPVKKKQKTKPLAAARRWNTSHCTRSTIIKPLSGGREPERGKLRLAADSLAPSRGWWGPTALQ